MSAGQSHYFDEQPAGPGTGRPRTVELQGRTMDVTTASGVFSGDRLDLGTQVLLRHAGPVPATGDLLDLGCGWGPITLAMAAAAPHATVWAVDVNERARELCRVNADANGVGERVRVVGPADVPAELVCDQIWSNPPVRVGKTALHELLATWLGRLDPVHGEAVLVVHKHLGSDSLARWLNAEGWPTERLASRAGYRVLRARPSGRSGQVA